MRQGSFSRRALLVLAVGTAIAAATPAVAEACGGFFRRRATKEVTVPSLEVEQVLIVHDPITEEEHFIREIVFRDAKEPFGFVVPVPSQPTIAKVDKSPFAALAARFPPEAPEPPSGLAGSGRGAGGDTGAGAGAPPVTVLSQERIGSFTAFVLAATDAGALTKWLGDNELVTTPESTAWLEHYVALGFTFAAFRYEVTAKKSASSKSETVRISFKTPLPYYPYREPVHVAEGPKRPRVLAVWFISPERSVPVAAVSEEGSLRWKRPWREARKHANASPGELTSIVGAASLGSLLPPPESEVVNDPNPRRLAVQTFEDQKTNRQGWGDIVLVPASPRAPDAGRLERMNKLMRSLDPAIGGPK